MATCARTSLDPDELAELGRQHGHGRGAVLVLHFEEVAAAQAHDLDDLLILLRLGCVVEHLLGHALAVVGLAPAARHRALSIRPARSSWLLRHALPITWLLATRQDYLS